MDKNDTIVINIVILALIMDDTIKRQEIIIERLQSDKKELLSVISKLKQMLLNYSPESIKPLEMFNL